MRKLGANSPECLQPHSLETLQVIVLNKGSAFTSLTAIWVSAEPSVFYSLSLPEVAIGFDWICGRNLELGTHKWKHLHLFFLYQEVQDWGERKVHVSWLLTVTISIMKQVLD